MFKRRSQANALLQAARLLLGQELWLYKIPDIANLHTRAWGTPTDGKPNFVAVLSLLSQPRWSPAGKSFSGLEWLQISCPTSASHPCFSFFPASKTGQGGAEDVPCLPNRGL